METPTGLNMASAVLQSISGNAPVKRSTSRKCYEFGEGRFLRLTASLVVLEDEINEKRIALNFQKYVKIAAKIASIDEAIVNQRDDARSHCLLDIGGSWFLSVGNGYRCVDIRKWYTDCSGKVRPSRVGLSLRYPEWEKFKEIVNEIRQHRPEVAAVVPCYNGGDHQNQEGKRNCRVFRVFLFSKILVCTMAMVGCTY